MKTLSIGDTLVLGNEEYTVVQIFTKSLSGNTYKVKNKRSGVFFVIKEFLDKKCSGNRDYKTNRLIYEKTDASIKSDAEKLCEKEIAFQRLVLSENNTNNRYVFHMEEYLDKDELGNTYAPLLSVYTEKGDVLSGYYKEMQGHINLKETIQIIKAICYAVNSLHKKNVLHLDLKPDNLFLEKEKDSYLVKILDLGSAQMMNEFDYQLFSLSSGTTAFRSPNVGILGNAYSKRQIERIAPQLSFYEDVYSIANIFLYLLLGRTYNDVKNRIPKKGERESEKFEHDLSEFGPDELVWCYSFINHIFERLKNKEYTCVITEDRTEENFSFYKDICILSDIVAGQGYYPESIRQNGNSFMKRYIANRKIRIDSKMIPDIEPRV